MRECKYYYKNDKTPRTYLDLIDDFNRLPEKDRNTIVDCLYRASNPKQEELKERLFKVKDKYVDLLKPSGDNSEYGNVEITFKQVNNRDVWSTQTFIDSDHFVNLDGTKIIFPLKREDFINHIIALNKDTLGEEGARNLGDLTVQHWDIIAQDSPILHEVFTKRWASLEALTNFLKDTKYAELAELLFNIVEGEDKSVNIYTKRRGILDGISSGSKLMITNLNMKCKLLGIDQEIIGHIDHIIIDDSGELHIVNYKVSTSQITDVKKEKYKYQLALLKQMLANEGFNVEHMTLSIIPIRVKYNDDFSKVTEVVPMDKVEYTIEHGRYTFGKYDLVASRFIPSTARINGITSDLVKKADYALKALFPDKGITSKGIELTAEQWIQDHYRVDINPGTNGVYWTVFFGKDDIVEIKDDPTHPLKGNKRIQEEVEKRLPALQIGNSYIGAHAILKKIKTWYSQGRLTSFSNEREFMRCGKYFDKLLAPYMLRRRIKEGVYEYDWEPIENDLLQNENILVFRNRVTKLLDIITISPYNLDVVVKMRDKYTNILGQYIGDNLANAQQVMKSNYGNIEAMRTMFLLNEVLSLIEGDYSLGVLQIVSPENVGGGKIYTFLNIIKQFTNALNVLTDLNQIKKQEYKNNFSGKKFIDSVQAFMLLKDHAMQEDLLTDTDKVNLKDWGLEILEETNSHETKLVVLKNLMKSMQDDDGGWGIPSNLDAINAWASRSEENKIKALLFLAVNDAILLYSGIKNQLDLNESDMSSMLSYMLSSSNIASINARIITSLFARAADRIADRSYKDSRPVLKYISDFYKSCGYTNVLNSTIGFLTRLFSNLFEEIDGKKTMRFKNPYVEGNGLKPHERKFLKQALFTFAKVRSKMFPRLKFDFTSYTDSGLEEFVNNPENSWYLEVPLTKATLASRRATGYTFKESWNRMKNLMTRAGMTLNFEEFFEGLNTEDELSKSNEDLDRMRVTNHFAWYETLNPHGGAAARASILNQKDSDFFETNVETLLMKFIAAQHEMEQMNDVLIQSKAVLLTLNNIGDVGNPRLKHTIKYITDYLTVNVFNRTIMEEDTKKVISTLAPAKHLATTVYILGNIASAVRDTTEGLLHNITRSVIKFQTNITSKELAKAYGIVMKDGTFSNVRTMNILNLLNIKYRISNVDVARIQEVLASGRAGLDNAENWAYATLRRPDFLNRMTLFVAKLIHDGVWDAISINEDGELIYNWKEDNRFKIYASGDTTNPEYLRQKGAYFSAILEYNREHPDTPLNIQDPEVALPQPYTSEYVESIKVLSNSIYGSYDKSTKAMYEHIAIGQALGQFTTWMNGMIGNYWRKPGSSTGELKEIHSTNEFGEFEFFDEYGNIVVQKEREDGSKYYLNEATNEEVTGKVLPVIKHVPVPCLGIIYSLINLASKIAPVGYKKNGLKGVMDEIRREIILNPQEAKNFRKLFSDLFMWIFMGCMYSFVVDPAYKDLKKNRNLRDLLANSIEDIIYRGTASSYDGFRGPWNVIDSFGNNMNPPAYKVTTKMITDVAKTTFGDKTVGLLVTQNVPVFRSFRQAYDAYVK